MLLSPLLAPLGLVIGLAGIELLLYLWLNIRRRPFRPARVGRPMHCVPILCCGQSFDPYSEGACAFAVSQELETYQCVDQFGGVFQTGVACLSGHTRLHGLGLLIFIGQSMVGISLHLPRFNDLELVFGSLALVLYCHAHRQWFLCMGIVLICHHMVVASSWRTVAMLVVVRRKYLQYVHPHMGCQMARRSVLGQRLFFLNLLPVSCSRM